MFRRSSAVQLTDRHEYLKGPTFGGRARQSEHDLHQMIRARRAGGLLSPPAHESRVVSAEKNLFPDLEIPRDERLAALHPKSSDQKQECRRRSVKTPGRGRRRIRRAQSRVKKPQPVGLRKICLLNSTHPREHVEIGDQPALILGQQSWHKSGGGRRACSDQLLPVTFWLQPPRAGGSAL